MNDPRVNPNWRGEKCPGCGEYLPSLLTDLCSYCQHQKDKVDIKKLRAMVLEVLGMFHQPRVFQQNTADRAKVLLESIDDK